MDPSLMPSFLPLHVVLRAPSRAQTVPDDTTKQKSREEKIPSLRSPLQKDTQASSCALPGQLRVTNTTIIRIGPGALQHISRNRLERMELTIPCEHEKRMQSQHTTEKPCLHLVPHDQILPTLACKRLEKTGTHHQHPYPRSSRKEKLIRLQIRKSQKGKPHTLR